MSRSAESACRVHVSRRHSSGRRAILLVLFTAAACDQPFNPELPFEQNLVVYSVLSNTTTAQAVRVYTTYSAESMVVGELGPDTRIKDALVLVEDISGLGVGPDTCRYDDLTGLYLWSSLSIERGHRYRMRVVPVGLDPVLAEVVVPGQAVVSPGSVLTLREPSTYTSDFFVSARLAPEAKAYVVRLLVEYEFFEAGQWIPGRIEVPSRAGAGPGGSIEWLYPTLSRRLGDETGGDTGYQILSFDHDAYLWALSQVQTRYLAQGLRFRRAVVHLTQVDVHLYKYYSIANGFQDPYTIRTDGPDYTNVEGGHGVFGAAVADSISITLPDFVR